MANADNGEEYTNCLAVLFIHDRVENRSDPPLRSRLS